MPVDASQFLAKPIPLTPLASSTSPEPVVPGFSFTPASPTKISSPYGQIQSQFETTSDNGGPSRRKWTWDEIVGIAAAITPIILNVAGILGLAVAIVQQTIPYYSVIEVGGTGRLDYGILGACATAVNSTVRICSPRTMQADFRPSILIIAQNIPGYGVFLLPLSSVQTASIFLTSLLLFGLSFLTFLPVWFVAYFPATSNRYVNRRLLSFIRDSARKFYMASGIMAFLAGILTVTIGIGYNLLFQGATVQFMGAIQMAGLQGMFYQGLSKNWTTELGSAFSLVWFVSFCEFTLAVGTNLALHNGIERKIESGEEKGDSSRYYGA